MVRQLDWNMFEEKLIVAKVEVLTILCFKKAVLRRTRTFQHLESFKMDSSMAKSKLIIQIKIILRVHFRKGFQLVSLKFSVTTLQMADVFIGIRVFGSQNMTDDSLSGKLRRLNSNLFPSSNSKTMTNESSLKTTSLCQDLTKLIISLKLNILKSHMKMVCKHEKISWKLKTSQFIEYAAMKTMKFWTSN